MTQIRVRAAFGVRPNSVPDNSEWVDISQYVESLTTNRGRSNERDRAEAGNATILLEDKEQNFDVTNENSPHYPDVVPGVRVRIDIMLEVDSSELGYQDIYRDLYIGTTNPVPFPIFEGFADGWHRSFAGGTEKVELPLTDGFKYLSLADTDIATDKESTGSRIGRLLDEANWPGGRRDIDSGQSQIVAANYDNKGVLNAIREVAETENGIFYIDRAGYAVFNDRHQRLLDEINSRITIPRFDSIDRRFDDSSLWNRVVIDYEGGKESAGDKDSQAKYGRKRLSRKLLIDDGNEANDAAHWLLNRYAEPHLRFDSISIVPVAQTNLQRFAAESDVGQKLTVRFYHVGDLQRSYSYGDLYSDIYSSDKDVEYEDLEMHIESIRHEFSGGINWKTTWRLSPAIARDRYWILGHDEFGVLGNTTRLAY